MLSARAGASVDLGQLRFRSTCRSTGRVATSQSSAAATLGLRSPRKNLRFAHLSWPKAVRAADGTIVLAYTAGVFHGDHGGGSPAISISTDEGNTFTAPNVLRKFGPDKDYTQSGNLAIGLADDGGVLAMAYTGGTGKIVGTAGRGNNIYGWRSTDSGHAGPRRIRRSCGRTPARSSAASSTYQAKG